MDNWLRKEGFNISEVAALRVACNNYLAERTDPTNSMLRDLTEAITTAFDSAFPEDQSIANIRQLFSAVETQLTSTKLLSYPAISQDKWKSITLVIAHEKNKL